MRPSKKSSESAFWSLILGHWSFNPPSFAPSFAGLSLFTIRNSLFMYCLPIVVIFSKKSARGGREANRKSTESTFGYRFPKRSNFPRVVHHTFGSEPFHFRVKNLFSHAHNDFDQSHLTPMITSSHTPENQISKKPRRRRTPPRDELLVIGILPSAKLVTQNPRPKST